MGLYGDQFKEKVAIVTGAGGGIGQAYAEALAREGAAVVVADINAAQARRVAAEISASGGRATQCRADVTVDADVATMVGAALDAYGALHIVVNNAGYTTPTSRCWTSARPSSTASTPST